MAKRKRFDLDVEEQLAPSETEVDRLFASQLATAQRPIVRDLPIDRIHPNPFQARRSFDDIEELAQSIRSLGFITRLRVRPHPEQPDQFQLVFGERRWRAAMAAGFQTVPCEIAPHPDTALLEMGLAENIQRQDLNPIEEAQAFKRFIDERGYTQQRLADRIGKDIAYVNRRLKLLDTPVLATSFIRPQQHMVTEPHHPRTSIRAQPRSCLLLPYGSGCQTGRICSRRVTVLARARSPNA
jgi:ParB/RepB/Spo0J family partition protein